MSRLVSILVLVLVALDAFADVSSNACPPTVQSPATNAVAPPGGAQTVTFTVDCWDGAFDTGHGNNCDFCSGQIQIGAPFTYNCNEGTTHPWTPECSFESPVPATATVTDVTATLVMLNCAAQRGYTYSRYTVLLNGTEIAPVIDSVEQNCGCGQEPVCMQRSFISETYPDGHPDYINGGTNQVKINVVHGAICVEKMFVTLKYKTDFRIELPADGEILPYDGPDYRSHTADFKAVAQPITSHDKVKWVTNLEFSDGPVTGFTKSDSFQNNLGAIKTRDFSGIGGKLTVTASRGSDLATSTAYIVGSEIPNPTITAKLLAIYSGPTPNLMTGIAFTESSYRQFNDSTLYGKTAKWPYRTGSYVGLMQVLGTMKRMWDWHENAEYAENFFSGEKRQIANSREHFYRNDSSYPGLRQLTNLEREDNTLWFYGPCSVHGDRFTPVFVGGGWNWQVNPINRQECVGDVGYDYVDRVRANLQ